MLCAPPAADIGAMRANTFATWRRLVLFGFGIASIIALVLYEPAALVCPQLCVDTVLPKQYLVRSLFYHAAAIQHQDAVHFLDGA